jgi:hypothetical protein
VLGSYFIGVGLIPAADRNQIDTLVTLRQRNMKHAGEPTSTDQAHPYIRSRQWYISF